MGKGVGWRKIGTFKPQPQQRRVEKSGKRRTSELRGRWWKGEAGRREPPRNCGGAGGGGLGGGIGYQVFIVLPYYLRSVHTALGRRKLVQDTRHAATLARVTLLHCTDSVPVKDSHNDLL